MVSFVILPCCIVVIGTKELLLGVVCHLEKRKPRIINDSSFKKSFRKLGDKTY